MKKFLATAVIALVSLASCSDRTVKVTFDTNRIISTGYIGNGAQWDPYQLDYGKGRVEISDADWQKLYRRLDYMRPGFIRMVMNTNYFIHEVRLDREEALRDLKPLLDYCQSRDVNVMFGDWGGDMLYPDPPAIDSVNLRHAAELTAWLVRDLGYTCIKWYNMVNEPNGDWSTNVGSYPLWADAIKYFHDRMVDTGIAERVLIPGPDAAIWTEDEAWWIDSCRTDLGKIIGLYDIHTYPSKSTVNSGRYGEIIRAYRERVPEGYQIVMGEVGLKFVEADDATFDTENKRRTAAHPFASESDSQMFVYDHVYGIAMADVLFQTMNEGFSGCIVWMMDDAMHSNEAPDKLKIWGFWNILGEEHFLPEDEQVRPFYYAWSLLCRFIPQESNVLGVTVENGGMVKAAAAEKDGRYTFAFVNPSVKPAEVVVNGLGRTFDGLKRYDYVEGSMIIQDEKQAPNQTGAALTEGIRIVIPADGLIVFTDME